jgi:DNA polymerase-3 subunit gamma/tau
VKFEPSLEYTVVARRYRPQQFADLVGQEPVAQALVNAITSGRIAHAYLFTGTRGVGKTTAARILAKALNCAQGPTPTPCDQCESCKGIAAGQDVDVLEIDGASNRRIEEVRDIRQNVQFRPTRGRYKIYIIDEVHMLTREAFNALLKTLEEPPPHVKFIVATTDVQKVPITILSRCQRFDFAGIAGDRIVGRLREVVRGEGMEADDEALHLVARRAGGSMRDAQSLLDQLLAFGGDRLTVEQVHQLLGTADEDQVAGFAAAILGRDAPKALALLDAGVGDGLQLGELVDQLIDYWRDLMLLACGGPDVVGLNASPRLRPVIRDQAAASRLDTILAGLDVLNTTKTRLRGVTHGRVLVEMTLVRLSRLDDLISVTQLAQHLQGGPPSAASQAAPPPRAQPAASFTARVAEAVEGKKKPPELTDGPSTALTAVTSETLVHVWPEILTQVGPILARELERAGLPAISGPNGLVLQFSSEYNRQQAYCSDPSRIQRIQDALRRVTGREWNVRVEAAAASNGIPARLSPEPTPVPLSAGAEVLQQPLVQAAVNALGAKLLQVDEGFGAVANVAADEAVPDETDGEEA